MILIFDNRKKANLTGWYSEDTGIFMALYKAFAKKTEFPICNL